MKFLVRVLNALGLAYWTVLAYVKLRGVGVVGSGLRAEGPVHIVAMRGAFILGRNIRLGPHVRLGSANNATLQIGNNVSVNQGSVIIACQSVQIGDDSRIGEYVGICDNDHGWSDPSIPIRKQGFTVKSVTIGRDVWLGRASVVCKGVSIGDGGILGAGAILTKSMPRSQVWAGNPARKIKDR